VGLAFLNLNLALSDWYEFEGFVLMRLRERAGQGLHLSPKKIEEKPM